MLTFDKRPCKIGPSINTRTEKHGDESVPAMDIPLTAILLDKHELNELLGDPHAWDCLFVERKGKPAEPMFAKSLKPFAVVGKFQECRASLWLGLKPELLELADVKLAKLKLEPSTGGMTALSVTVQSPCEESAARLLQFLDSQIDVALDFGDAVAGEEEQPELELEHGTPVKREKVDTAKRRKPKSDDAVTVN